MNLPNQCFISFITKDYLYLADKLIESVKIFSEKPIIIYTYNFDHDFKIQNVFSKRIDDKALQKPLFISSTKNSLGVVDRFDFNTFYNLTRKFEVILQSLSDGINEGVFLDCDIIVNNNIDEIFNNFFDIENYPLVTKGIFEYMMLNGKGNPFEGQDVLEKPLMDLLAVKERSMHYVQTNTILFNKNCTQFFNECIEVCKNEKIIYDSGIYAPFQDETIVNVLLWKYNAKKQLPIQYFNLIDKKQLEYFYENDCENTHYQGSYWHYFSSNKSDIKYFHGCKDEKILSDCISFLKNKHNKIKVAIVTLYDKNYKDLAEYSLPNKNAYAKKYNYDFYHFDDVLDSSKPPQWNKILAVKNILEKNIYDWVWWIDIDSLILNFNIQLESIIDSNFEIIFTKNNYSYISSGSCFFKNTELVKNFLDDVFYLKKSYLANIDINIFDHEQQAIRLLLQNDEKYKNKTKLIHERVCNSYCKTTNLDVLKYYANWNNEDNIYKQGDFVIQFCGRSMCERINDFLKYLLPKKISIILLSDDEKIIFEQKNKLTNENYDIEFYTPKLINKINYNSFSNLINESINECSNEFMIFVNPKCIVKKDDIDFILKKLHIGYGLVTKIGFGYFGTTKQLFREIGLFDENFIGGEWEDNDFALRLKLNNIAVYAEYDENNYDYNQSFSYYNKKRGSSLSYFLQKWNPSNLTNDVNIFNLNKKYSIHKKISKHLTNITNDIKYYWLSFDQSDIYSNYYIFNNIKNCIIKIDNKNLIKKICKLNLKIESQNLKYFKISLNSQDDFDDFLTISILDVSNLNNHHCYSNGYLKNNQFWSDTINSNSLLEIRIYHKTDLLYSNILFEDIDLLLKLNLICDKYL